MINVRNAKACCCEDLSKIENYQEAVADDTKVWDVHHRRETDDGISRRELIRRKEYFHRCASELIFLPHDQHTRIHSLGNKHMLGKHLSEATRKKLSLAKRGEKCYLFGKHLSKATRKKMSQALSGEKNPMFGKTRPAETRKRISLAKIGYYWWNNGVENVLARSCPPGFVRGRLPWKNMEKKEDERAERL